MLFQKKVFFSEQRDEKEKQEVKKKVEKKVKERGKGRGGNADWTDGIKIRGTW